MSFAKRVKEELVALKLTLIENKAELYAFLSINSEVCFSERGISIDFKSNNPTIAKRFWYLVKAIYQVDTELITMESGNLSRKKTVIVRVISKAKEIIEEYGLLNSNASSRRLETELEKRAYMRGAFLVSGSVNTPLKSEYHLEIYSDLSNEILFLQAIINGFELDARIAKRRKGFIVYIKRAEAISMFLQLIEANEGLLFFEDYRIRRDFSNSINRVINLELANENKILESAKKELIAIELIESNNIKLSYKHQQILELRKKHPEASLKELVEHYTLKHNEKITKSGVAHRLNFIKEIANNISEYKNKKSSLN